MSPVRARIVKALALTAAAAGAVLVCVWALTGGGAFWPVHALLGMALALAIVAWTFAVVDRPAIRTGGSVAAAVAAGIGVAVVAYAVLLWSVTGAGYFWPGWLTVGLGIAATVVVVVELARREHARTHRIEELETSRSGAVDVQESELRRIERDLHDGAQARLVALGMSLGMAEEKLESDPEAARALLSEARAGAREALEELRDLARGIRPPLLTDRGLEAAVAALAARSPLPVSLRVDLPARPGDPVETAVYFVVAEALANAIKHGNATEVDVAINQANGRLVAEGVDNGRGGADPAGSGLTGLRRRVESFDGTLAIDSPVGGPTHVAAELPCA